MAKILAINTISKPEVSVNNEHDPVEPSIGFVQLFQRQEGQEAAAQKKESFDARKCIGHHLKRVGVCQLLNQKHHILDFGHIYKLLVQLSSISTK